MKKAMTLVTLVASLTATAHAQENKANKEACQGVHLITCLSAAGSASIGASVTGNAISGRITFDDEARTGHRREFLSVRDLENRLARATPDESIWVNYQEPSRIQQAKAIAKYESLIPQTERRIRELEDWINGFRLTASQKRQFRAELEGLKGKLPYYRSILNYAKQGVLMEADKPTFQRSFHISQERDLRYLLNDIKENKYRLVSAEVSRDADQIARAGRSIGRRIRGGVVGIAAGAGIAAYEYVRTQKVEDVQARESEIATDEYKTQTRPVTLTRSASE